MRTLSPRLVPLCSLLLLLAACGDDGTSTPMGDAGPVGGDAGEPDAGEPDAGPMFADLPTCEMPRTVEGELGTVTVSGDTTDGPMGPRDLGLQCGNPDAARWAPQEVLEYLVPGSGPVAVEMSLVDEGTPTSFDTVLQVRQDCTTIPEPALTFSCFDDTGSDLRSSGAVTVEGGSSLFILVTGYAETPVAEATDRGPWTLTITARENTPPEITGGEVRIIGPRAEFVVDGTDPDGDPGFFAITFQDDAGDALDLDGSGSATAADTLRLGFDNLAEIDGSTDYQGHLSITALGSAVPELGTLLSDLGAAQAEVVLVDAGGAASAPATLPVRTVNEVGLGATCDADNVCVLPLTCGTSATCEAPAELVDACAAATSLAVATPADTTTTASASGTLEPGDGVLTGSCAPTSGAEVLYTVTVPAGSFDLLARTDLDGTADTDTVVYVRSACEDPLGEVACNDDIDTSGMVYSSSLEVLDAAPGTYTVAVEHYDTAAASAPYELEVSLRPVLASGASCDPAGVDNRCAGGACDGTSSTCP